MGVSVGTDGNTYVIEDNFLVYGATQEVLTAIATNFLNYADYAPYTPCSFISSANPWLEVGDVVKVTATDKILTVPILNRRFKGIQSPKDTYQARGTEKYSDTYESPFKTEIKQLRSRTNKLTQTIDETRSEITRVEKDVNGELVKMQSSITQTAQSINTKVSKGDVVSEINQSAEEISLKGNRVVIQSDKFKLNADGTIQSTGGSIGGWEITDEYLQGVSSAGSYMRMYPGGKQYVSDGYIRDFFIVVYTSSGTPLGGITASGWQTI